MPHVVPACGGSISIPDVFQIHERSRPAAFTVRLYVLSSLMRLRRSLPLAPGIHGAPLFAPRHLTGGSSLHWGMHFLGVGWKLEIVNGRQNFCPEKESQSLGIEPTTLRNTFVVWKDAKGIRAIAESFRIRLCNFRKTASESFSFFPIIRSNI
jgi:hypothetical protein